MAQQPSTNPQYTYIPPPTELPYYNALFATADTSSSGHLSGPTAVEFLSLSKLPIDLLKQIWTMADSPPTNTLDVQKFHVAVRLIQLFQNGKKPVDLALNVDGGDGGMRAPYFEGVNVQQAVMMSQGATQMTQQQQQQQQAPPSPQLGAMSNQPPPVVMNGGGSVAMPGGGGVSVAPVQQQQALTTQDPYNMSPQELVRYGTLFPSYAVQDADGSGQSYVHGGAAVELFSKSGMDRESLKAIWSMCDNPVDNKLDSLEFSIAMHLIVCVTKKNLPMPPTLPLSLVAIFQQQRGGGGGIISGGQSVIGGGQSVVGAPPSPGGIPSPDKMGMMQQHQQQQQQQQLQMNGEMQQMGMMGATAQQQPQMMQPQMGIQQNNSFGGGVPVAGGTVDDAFAGMSNEPIDSVDEYSAVGGVGDDGVGGQPTATAMSAAPVTVQEVATPEPSPQPVAPTIQRGGMVVPPPPMVTNQHPPSPVTNGGLPPRSPRSRGISAKGLSSVAGAPASEESTAELISLREAHQKLQAEVISLRAKAASVSDEEQETQKEIAHLAGDIGKLSMELSDLKESVMEAKVKLGESVGILKVQMEKKGSLESQVEEARATYEALTSANAAVEEANELAIAQQAHSVAAAAIAKEEALAAPAVEEAPPQQQPEADLFSWDAAPAPVSAPVPTQEAVPTWASDAPTTAAQEATHQQHANTTTAESVASVTHHSPVPVQHQEAMSAWGSDAPSMAQYDTHSVAHESTVVPHANPSPNPYGMPAMGAYEPQQQLQQPNLSPMGPMGGSIPEPMGGYDYQQQQPPTQQQLTPTRDSFASAPAPQQQPVGPPSPSKEELEVVKNEAVRAESSFRSCTDLVRSISTEVVKLESAAKKAEADMSVLEGKTKKGSFVGGKKKKAKKEYEKALEAAQGERQKVQNAKEQLAAAEREAEKSKNNMESLRRQYEDMELQAATAASYISANAHQTQNDQHSVAGGSMAQPAMYNDPFGGGTMNNAAPPAAPAAASSDPYGMGVPMMGGAPSGYENPFL